MRRDLTNLYRKLMTRICSFMILPVLTPGAVTVSWDANTENDLAGYRIYYGERSRNYDLQITVGEVTSHRIDGLTPGKRYFFAVTAYDLSGNESGFSSEVSVDIPQDPDDPSPPPPPSDDGPTTLGARVYNFPNPFRVGQETTSIRYELSSPGDITIEILDMNNSLVNKLVANGFAERERIPRTTGMAAMMPVSLWRTAFIFAASAPAARKGSSKLL